MADVQNNPVTQDDNKRAAQAAANATEAQAYHQDSNGRIDVETTAGMPVPEQVFDPASQIAPKVEVDLTNTPQVKGSKSGVWKEGDKAQPVQPEN